MHIVLSTSPHIKHSAVLEADFTPRNDLMYTFAPLGILMLCSSLRNELNITPTIYDINSCINNDEIRNTDSFYESAADSVLKTQPDILGFMTECDSYHHVLQICAKIKERRPQCFIMLGGPHATAVAMPTMKKWNCIDAIVLGEGEITFVELISSILGNMQKAVPGSIIRSKSGAIIDGGSRSLVETLDMLPFPAYDLYTPLVGEELFVEAGRGCPFKCTFCSTSPFWERKHRVKSPNRLVEEIKYIRKFHAVERVHFTHDLFTTNRNWVEDVCHTLISSEVNIKWTCSSRIDTISESLIALMAKAGCNAIFFGIESGSERVLKIIDKDIPFERTVEIVSLCYKYGISPNGGLILGFPFEDDQSFNDTFNAYLKLLTLGTKPIHIFSYCPFAQSSLYNSLEGLECTGYFLDIPLGKKVDHTNRQLIKNDFELFGSYFRPRLENKIKGIESGMIHAVDEFVVLVDAVRIPSILIAEKIGGMATLFFEWVSYISHKNECFKKAIHRKYFGSPEDYCDFLNVVYNRSIENLPAYVPSLLIVIAKNLQISKVISHKEPTAMATYRSKSLHKNLQDIRYESKIDTDSVIDSITIDYNIIPILYAATIPNDFIPEKRAIHLVWVLIENSGVSLIQVNEFIQYVIREGGNKTINEVVKSWSIENVLSNEINLVELFENLQEAQKNQVITINH